jgi:hypothetical protein
MPVGMFSVLDTYLRIRSGVNAVRVCQIQGPLEVSVNTQVVHTRKSLHQATIPVWVKVTRYSCPVPASHDQARHRVSNGRVTCVCKSMASYARL